MIKIILPILTSFAFGIPAWSQEFGATIGVHRATADSNDSNMSVEGQLNYKLGMLVAFDLVDQMKFRSGLIYNQRHIDIMAGGQKYEYNFNYFDIPANVQYNFTESVGIFGGLVVAALISDDVDIPASSAAVDPNAESLIPLLNLGVNLLFSDMVGFDLYYERGMGRFANKLENHTSFGGNFIYWF